MGRYLILKESEMSDETDYGFSKGILSAEKRTAPTPPAQEDEPIYDSYLTNSTIISRTGDAPLFGNANGNAFFRLDSYTIMPSEQFDELRKAAEQISDCFDDDTVKNVPRLIKAIKNLRAALEKK